MGRTGSPHDAPTTDLSEKTHANPHGSGTVADEASRAPGPFDVQTIKHLVALMSRHDLSEIDLRDGAAARRGSAPATAADDLGDPVLGGFDEHVEMLSALVPAVRTIAEAISRVKVPA